MNASFRISSTMFQTTMCTTKIFKRTNGRMDKRQGQNQKCSFLHVYTIWYLSKCVQLTNSFASRKWITGVSIWTSANWIMIACMTNRFNTTCVRTWIGTFLIDASSIRWTFTIYNTFRSTFRWYSNVSRWTCAHCLSSIITAITIWSTWWWWTNLFWYWWWCWHFTTLWKWITS